MNQQHVAKNNDANNDQAQAEKTCINEKCKRTKGNNANNNSKEIRWRKSKGLYEKLKKGEYKILTPPKPKSKKQNVTALTFSHRREFFLLRSSSITDYGLRRREKTDQLSIFYPYQ